MLNIQNAEYSDDIYKNYPKLIGDKTKKDLHINVMDYVTKENIFDRSRGYMIKALDDGTNKAGFIDNGCSYRGK